MGMYVQFDTVMSLPASVRSAGLTKKTVVRSFVRSFVRPFVLVVVAVCSKFGRRRSLQRCNDLLPGLPACLATSTPSSFTTDLPTCRRPTPTSCCCCCRWWWYSSMIMYLSSLRISDFIQWTMHLWPYLPTRVKTVPTC